MLRNLAVFTLAITIAVPVAADAGDAAAARRARYEQYLAFETLVPPTELTPEWLPDGSRFRYLETAADGMRTAVTVDPARNTLTRAAAPAAFGTPPSRPKTFGHRFILTDPIPVPEIRSPDGRHYALVKDGDVWLRSAADDGLERITTTGVPDYGWDLESMRLPVALRANNVDPWSPKGDRLFATRSDRRGMHRTLEIDFLTPDTSVRELQMETSGVPLPKVTLYLLDLGQKHAIPIDVGDTAECYFTLLGWLPDGAEVLFARASRDFKRVDIMAADAKTGAARVVLAESGPTWVRIAHDVLYSGRTGFNLLPDGKGFIWESERDGWNHLYLYDLKGHLVRRLTQGEFPVAEVEAIDQKRGFVYLTAHADTKRVYDVHLYRVPLKGGRLQQLTAGEGQHSVEMSPSRQWFIDTHSAVARPPTVELRSADGRLVRTLKTTSLQALKAAGWMPPEEFVVKAADGKTDLWGVMYKPADFDPAKKYPLVDQVYGGPQIAYTRRGFDALPIPHRNHPQALAQLGYVVVMLDSRGTPERSKAFHDAIYGNWDVVTEDHAAAMLELVAEHPYLDGSRIGIYGHSWGGRSAVRALALRGDVFKAAVASGPALATGFLDEPYLGLQPRDREALARNETIPLASKINRPLMLVAGTKESMLLDDAVRMSRALIDSGVQHRLVVLPGESHGYRGKALDYVLEATTDFFEKNLRTSLTPGDGS